MFFKSGKVCGGAVAFVLCELIAGKLCIQREHQPVAGDFGNHARRSDAETETVATNKGSLRNRKRLNRQPIDQDVVWLRRQASDCTAHPFVGRSEYIQPVDFPRLHDGKTPENRRVVCEFIKQNVTLAGCEFFGVREDSVAVSDWKDNSRRNDWSGKRAAPCFIDSRNKTQTPRTKLVFVREAANL